MKIEFKNNQITFNKQLNNLDNFVIDFISILNELDIQYVIISGYVSILFGRNRASEDIDIFVEKINYTKFKAFWERLHEKFECIITTDPKDAYNTYLLDETALRFAQKDEIIPNIELKFPTKDVDKWTLKNRLKVICNKNEIYISPIELQIAYKLFLSSEKDNIVYVF